MVVIVERVQGIRCLQQDDVHQDSATHCTSCRMETAQLAMSTSLLIFLLVMVRFVNAFDCTYKSYCCTVHFRRITSIYQPMNAHIISHNTHLKHFKTQRHISVLSDHHQGALFLAKVILRYSQFNSYLQTRCCGSISCCVGMCYGAVARCATHTKPLLHNTT